MLNKVLDDVISFRKKDGSINRKAVIDMFKKDSEIWVEYGCGGVAHIFVLIASLIWFKKVLILNVHDFSIDQRYTSEYRKFIKEVRLKIIEYLLLKRADVIILPCPGLLDYFKPKKNQKVLVMPPGVGENELFIPAIHDDTNDKEIKRAMYFGSMKRKDAIPKIIELFSGLDGWELQLIGLKEGEEIIEKENVKYLGSVSHDKLADFLSNTDVILIPLPKNEYLDIAMPTKFAYALKSCKPVVVTKLKGISEHVSLIGLEENIIFVEEWNFDTLKEMLNKALQIKIDAVKTIERLKSLAWEPRFIKVIEIALNVNRKNQYELEWI
ncbi:MAG: glycosyltransferase [Halobacteriota archaeon]|nr:glycosyltransferase [Halobacteriota archaeon]